MPRWRLMTWAFLVFNVLMVGVLGLVLWDPFDPSSCDHIPYGSDSTACAMGAGLGDAVESVFRVVAIVLVWSMGLIILGIAWVATRNNGPDGGDRTP